MVLEGGSIDVNGRGTLLTTEECLLSKVQERNPGLHARGLCARFSRAISARRTSSGSGAESPATTRTGTWTIWRGSWIPTTVVTVVEDDPADENYEPLQENLALLKSTKDQDGAPLRVETLPMPRARVVRRAAAAGELREFLHREQDRAGAHVQRSRRPHRARHAGRAFPHRAIVPIYCRDLVLGLGTIHCMTQQLPRI